MPEIFLDVPISALPEKVYAAITEAEGLSKWWAPEVIAEPTVGTTSQIRFRDGEFVIEVEVTELEPVSRVAWGVRKGAPDWTGTRVTWDLIRKENGTHIRFAHRGFASTEGSFGSAGFNWAWYLASLKDYVEQGKGRPGEAPR